MLEISSLLEEIKASPYEEIIVTAPRSGVIEFPEDIIVGSKVVGVTGDYKETSGTLIATITREKNPQAITCTEKGEVVTVHKELHGKYVEAGTEVLRLRHFLSSEEVVQIILKQALHLFTAPERAKYYFVPAVDIKIKVSGPKAVSVKDGDELFIQSRMKREASLRYTGPEGIIYALYFSHNENVDAGAPLIGVCPPELVEQVEEVIVRIQTEWKEQS